MNEFHSQTPIEYYRGDTGQQFKPCKHCRQMIDPKAKVCPYCRKSQSNTLLTVLIIGVALFFGVPFLVGFIHGITGQTTTSTVKTGSTSNTENSINQIVYDDRGIKIFYKGTNETSRYIDLYFLIENNTDTNYCVQERNFSVNDFMISTTFSADVAAHKKINDNIRIYKSDLSDNNIKDIEKTEFNFHIFEWNHISGGFDTETITLY